MQRHVQDRALVVMLSAQHFHKERLSHVALLQRPDDGRVLPALLLGLGKFRSSLNIVQR